MKKAAVLLVCLLSVTVLAQDIRFNFARDADFSKFKTYKWVQLKGAEQIDDLTDNAIRTALDAQLARKGFTKTEADNADLYVAYQASVAQEKQFTSFSTGWGYGPGWGGGWYGMGPTTTHGETSTIYTGQLVFDMYDAANHALVWRGVASKTLDAKAKPDKRQKNIDKAAAKLLKNYPPGK